MFILWFLLPYLSFSCRTPTPFRLSSFHTALLNAFLVLFQREHDSSPIHTKVAVFSLNFSLSAPEILGLRTRSPRQKASHTAEEHRSGEEEL